MKLRSYGAPFVVVLLPVALAVAACGDDAAEEDPSPSAGRSGATAGTPGGGAVGGVAGRASGSGGSSAGTSAGRNGSGASGALPRAGAGSSATAGSGAVHNDAGGAGESSGGADSGTPPGPGPGGKSVYAVECRGDSLDCQDPALRCLGLRDGNTVLGYSCSNECQTATDCSSAPSGAEATAGCVDFAIAKHCVLVCQDATGQRSCPSGMSCYVYPGAPIGYCLWR